jgi:hypothetical protein
MKSSKHVPSPGQWSLRAHSQTGILQGTPLQPLCLSLDGLINVNLVQTQQHHIKFFYTLPLKRTYGKEPENQLHTMVPEGKATPASTIQITNNEGQATLCS